MTDDNDGTMIEMEQAAQTGSPIIPSTRPSGYTFEREPDPSRNSYSLDSNPFFVDNSDNKTDGTVTPTPRTRTGQPLEYDLTDDAAGLRQRK